MPRPAVGDGDDGDQGDDDDDELALLLTHQHRPAPAQVEKLFTQQSVEPLPAQLPSRAD